MSQVNSARRIVSHALLASQFLIPSLTSFEAKLPTFTPADITISHPIHPDDARKARAAEALLNWVRSVGGTIMNNDQTFRLSISSNRDDTFEVHCTFRKMTTSDRLWGLQPDESFSFRFEKAKDGTLRLSSVQMREEPFTFEHVVKECSKWLLREGTFSREAAKNLAKYLSRKGIKVDQQMKLGHLVLQRLPSEEGDPNGRGPVRFKIHSRKADECFEYGLKTFGSDGRWIVPLTKYDRQNEDASEDLDCFDEFIAAGYLFEAVRFIQEK